MVGGLYNSLQFQSVFIGGECIWACPAEWGDSLQLPEVGENILLLNCCGRLCQVCLENSRGGSNCVPSGEGCKKPGEAKLGWGWGKL